MPTNAVISFAASAARRDDGSARVVLTSETGQTYSGQLEPSGADPNNSKHTFVFRPEQLLPADTAFRAVIEIDGIQQGTEFRTGTASDSDPPSRPEAFAVQLASFVPATVCTPAHWEVELEWEHAFDDLSEVTYEIRGDRVRRTRQSHARLQLTPEQTARIQVCAVDAAGNETCSKSLAVEAPPSPVDAGVEDDDVAMSCRLSVGSTRGPRTNPLAGMLVALMAGLTSVVARRSRTAGRTPQAGGRP